VIATIGCDRVTKEIATITLSGAPGRSYLSGVIRLEYAENTGGFLGLGASLPEHIRTTVFVLATGLLLAGGTIVIARGRLRGSQLVGAVLFIAAGSSNWIDRVLSGTVVDFMVVGAGPIRTGIFNVADAVMMMAAAIVLWAEVRQRPAPPAPEQADPA